MGEAKTFNDPRAELSPLENLVRERDLGETETDLFERRNRVLAWCGLLDEKGCLGSTAKFLLDQPVSKDSLRALYDFVSNLSTGEFDPFHRSEIPSGFDFGRWFSLEGAHAALAAYEGMPVKEYYPSRSGLGLVQWGLIDSLSDDFISVERMTVLATEGFEKQRLVGFEWAGFTLGEDGASAGERAFCFKAPVQRDFVTKADYIFTVGALLEVAAEKGEDCTRALSTLLALEVEPLKESLRKVESFKSRTWSAVRLALLAAAVPVLIGASDVDGGEPGLLEPVNLTKQSYE
jgi:hypothetical protein